MLCDLAVFEDGDDNESMMIVHADDNYVWDIIMTWEKDDKVVDADRIYD